jgi:hypothetical protein
MESARVGVAEKRLELRQPQPWVRDDLVEPLHQDALGQGRQVGEIGVLGARPEHVAVGGRAPDGVADQRAQTRSLVLAQLLVRPAVAL